ncbi:MAG TPA: NADH-quinone oxidoreductase subunit NuoH [Thermoleophilia bacterium]|nr:NADH-quinone oxidoreductase subunit NuoH [Thermoleophilia bacterium]HQJ98646.1 NADH-quinone oxidoreductase subunit NuoH [Thermoleophilia bacterium]
MDVFLEILRLVVCVIVAYAVVFVAALVNIVFERRFLAFMQDRHGPNRVGPHGIFQSIADAFKMIGKEDFRPAFADRGMFILAPIMVMIGAVAVQLTMPYTKGFTPGDLNVGLIYIVAVTSFTTMAILVGGWASRNKYSLVGALRSAAQMISYEIPMLLAILVIAMVVGSWSLNDVVDAQADYKWIGFYMPFTFLLYAIAAISELNRGPFDLPESESELVSGYGTEYSGMRFGMFFLNEYAGMTIMSMVAVTLFFGGWHGPFEDALVIGGVAIVPFIWFMVKTYILVFALVWVRLSLPRLQVDQLMGFAWKILIPLGLLNIALTAAVILWVPHWRWGLLVVGWVSFAAFVGLFDPILKRRLRRQRERLPVVSS